MIKSVITVYHWFLRQALTGASVVARRPTGEEIALEASGNHLSPEELGVLAKQLASAPDRLEAARFRERLTRGFYGI